MSTVPLAHVAYYDCIFLSEFNRVGLSRNRFQGLTRMRSNRRGRTSFSASQCRSDFVVGIVMVHRVHIRSVPIINRRDETSSMWLQDVFKCHLSILESPSLLYTCCSRGRLCEHNPCPSSHANARAAEYSSFNI